MSLDKAIDAKHSLSGKILSIFLSLVLVVGFMPLPARAYADDEVRPVAVSDESGGESAQSVADVPDGAPAAGDESSDVGGGGEEPVTPAPAATPDEGSSEGSDVGGAPSDGGEAGGEGGEAAPTDTPSGSGVEGSSDVTNPQGADTPGTADVTEGNGNTAPEGTGEGAEGDGDGQEGEPTRDVTYVAQIGEMGYESLEAAIAAAQDGQTIVLLQDINLTDSSAYTNNRIPITHSITIDGGNHTVTVINRGFGVGEGAANSVMLDVVFKNITINNASSGARCIDTRGHINSLTLDHVTLSTQGGSGYTQPLTIGGNQASVATIIITNSTIETNSEGTAYYAIITFNPVNMTITNSTIKGWACIYAKGKDSSAGSAGSVFTITGSTLVSKNVYSGTSNAFSMFMAEDNNVKFVVTNSRLEVTQTGDQCQAIVSAEDFTGVVAKLGEGNTVTFTGEKATFVSNDAEAEITGGRFNKAVPEEYLADGFELVSNSDGTYSVAEKTYAAKIGETKYATFEDAVAAANGMTGDVTIELLGNVTWTTGASHGSTPLLTADSACTSLTINGNGHTLTAVGQGIGSLRAANGGTLNFNNMTIKDESVSYAENSWEHGYLEFGGKLTFTNVDFVNAIMLTQDNGQQEHCDATFTNCSFNSNAANEYDIWVSQGDATFIDCEFTGYRGAKTHEAYGSEVGTLTFKQCSFENLSKKPGLAVGTVNADTTVIFDSCTFDNVQAGDQGLYILESDTNLADYNLEFYNSAKVDGVEALAARIGNRGYLTVEEGFAAVKAGETLEILKAGTYSLPSSIANITVKGNVDGVVFNHTGTGSIASIPNGATFENVTFNFGTENYHGFQHAGTITMKDCTINGKFFSYGDMVFEGCTFNAPSGDYSMWAYAGNLTYT
ncbi:MAG: hypothetical protein IJG53_07865, partial [Eggerthellaceae bacterium]|nr:hypothetical protein [Eggerthellaceae bacterium]